MSKKSAAKSSAPVWLAPLTVIGGIICAFIFLSQRGRDIGALPQLLSAFFHSFGGHEIQFKALAEAFAGIIVALLLAVAWYGAGGALEKLFARFDASGGAHHAADANDNTALRCTRQIAFGAGAWSLVWFFLGTLSLYYRAVALAALLLGLTLAAWDFNAHRRANIAPETQSTPVETSDKLVLRILRATLLVLLALTLIAALAPPTAKDALLYHLALPRAYVAAHNNAIIPYHIASYLPLGVEMQSVWAMLTGDFFNARTGEAASSVTTFLFLPLLALFIFGWARALTRSRTSASLASLLVVSVPTVYHVASNAYTDVALALYTALAVHAFARWQQTYHRADLLRLAFALGCALCLKLTAIFLMFPLVLLILWQARKLQNQSSIDESAPTANKVLLSGIGALALACVIASPWYLRTWRQTGSPFFPFYLNILSARADGWDAARSQLFQTMNARYGGAEKSALNYLAAPLTVSLAAQPEEPARYDGVLGFAFLCGLPLLLWACFKPDVATEVKTVAFIAGMLFLFWLFFSPQLRYLLPALPLLAVATAGAPAALKVERKRGASDVFSRALGAACLIAALTGFAWWLEQNPLPVVLGAETRDAYLTRRLDYYPYYELVNTQLPPESRVWLVNLRRDTYHLQRAYFSDYLFEDYTLAEWVKTGATVAEMRDRARATGITHALVRHDLLFDYALSPVTDARLSEAENRERLTRLKAFFTQGTNIIRQDDKFMLVAFPR